MKNFTTIALIVLGVVILIVGWLILQKHSSREGYSLAPNAAGCEFQEPCLWDTARWVTMNDGTQGVCTLHGMACPAFSMNHSRTKYLGRSPSAIDRDYYSNSFPTYSDMWANGTAGETALQLGGYPTG